MRRLLYDQAQACIDGTWLIVPVLESDGHYTFQAFDPEGSDWVDHRLDYQCCSVETALTVGRAFVATTIEWLAEVA